jgi:hypothetical protein
VQRIGNRHHSGDAQRRLRRLALVARTGETRRSERAHATTHRTTADDDLGHVAADTAREIGNVGAYARDENVCLVGELPACQTVRKVATTHRDSGQFVTERPLECEQRRMIRRAPRSGEENDAAHRHGRSNS